MEAIVALIIIIVLCKILGVSNTVLIMCALGLIELTIIAMLLFFIFFCLNLLFSKRRKAKFTRFGKAKSGKFTVAFYSLDDAEFPCVFPKESFTGKNSYSTEREYTVFYNKLLKKVFDMWSVTTCIVGLIFSSFAVFFTLRILSWLADM